MSAENLATFATGAQYQLVHGAALLALAGLSPLLDSKWYTRSVLLLGFGLLVFCGSLYVLGVGGERRFGIVAPLGGLCLLAGWLACIAAIAKGPRGE